MRDFPPGSTPPPVLPCGEHRAGYAVRAIYEVDGRDRRLIDPLVVVVDRSDVEMGDIQPTVRVLSRLLADAETVREYRERVDIAFHGYDTVFMGECLIFSAFPLDVIVSAEFGAHRDAVRGRLRERLFLALQGVMDGLPMEQFTEFAAHFQQRADEYIETWKSAEGSLGLERLGRATERAIYGPDVGADVRVFYACSVAAAAAFSSFKGFSSKYEVVTG